MPRSRALQVVGSKRVAELLAGLRPRQTLEHALESGSITRTKVVGRWIYAQSPELVDLASVELHRAEEELLQDWFVAPLRVLAAASAKRIERPVMSVEAAESLTRQLIQAQRFDVIGLLTRDDCEPYFAITSPVDREELRRQVNFVSAQLCHGRAVCASDLPELTTARPFKAWREQILRHGEFLGLGAFVGDALVPWREL